MSGLRCNFKAACPNFTDRLELFSSRGAGKGEVAFLHPAMQKLQVSAPRQELSVPYSTLQVCQQLGLEKTSFLSKVSTLYAQLFSSRRKKNGTIFPLFFVICNPTTGENVIKNGEQSFENCKFIPGQVPLLRFALLSRCQNTLLSRQYTQQLIIFWDFNLEGCFIALMKSHAPVSI